MGRDWEMYRWLVGSKGEIRKVRGFWLGGVVVAGVSLKVNFER